MPPGPRAGSGMMNFPRFMGLWPNANAVPRPSHLTGSIIAAPAVAHAPRNFLRERWFFPISLLLLYCVNEGLSKQLPQTEKNSLHDRSFSLPRLSPLSCLLYTSPSPRDGLLA